MGEALSQRVPLIVTVAQQVARGEVEVVEVELGARALMVAIAMQDQTLPRSAPPEPRIASPTRRDNAPPTRFTTPTKSAWPLR
jgi:hypothetical protein